jgi:plastocyanin/predicted phosphodiesterase
MSKDETRRDFLRLFGLGGVVFASGLAGCAPAVRGAEAPGASGLAPGRREDFYFLQLSDTHWGFKGPPNPEADTTLKKTVATIAAAARKPDFVVFTGDLTHTTDDAAVRRARMREFKEIIGGLGVPDVRFLPGEHDASLDRGEAYQEAFGALHYAFDHKGIHFVALDNVSDPAGALGDAQLDWLARDLATQPRDRPIVVLAHRPLFDLYPAWEWATRDGAKAVAILSGYDNVTVFYGHIHQEHHQMTGRIAHHSARSLIFPLPAPGAAPKRAPLPWDPTSPTHGLGYRSVEPAGAVGYRIAELGPASSAAATVDRTGEDDAVVRVSARRFEFTPSTIRLRRAVPVTLELVAMDHVHGFSAPGLGLRSELTPGRPVRLRVVAERAGRFPFFCDVFCGDGHEDMSGAIVVE